LIQPNQFSNGLFEFFVFFQLHMLFPASQLLQVLNDDFLNTSDRFPSSLESELCFDCIFLAKAEIELKRNLIQQTDNSLAQKKYWPL